MSEPRIPLRWEMDLADLTKFDLVTAAMAGWVSYYAYYENADAWYRGLLPASKVNRIPADPATGRPQGWVVRLPECNMVVFAGTTEMNQLYRYVMSATFSPLRPTGPTEYVGTLYAKWARAVYADFHTLLHATMDNAKTLYVGHSAGGALAAALLRYVQGDGIVTAFPSTSYTFGCPRVGDKAFQAQSAPWFNVVIADDPVPKLPFAGMVTFGNPLATLPTYGAGPAANFHRHGKVYYIGDDGYAIAQTNSLVEKSMDNSLPWDAVKAAVTRFGPQKLGNVQRPDNTIRDFNRHLDKHFMRTYLDRMMSHLGGWDNNGIGDWTEEGLKLEVQLPPSPLSDPPLLVTIPTDSPVVVLPGVTPLRVRRHH